jgi:hypothetical protein
MPRTSSGPSTSNSPSHLGQTAGRLAPESELRIALRSSGEKVTGVLESPDMLDPLQMTEVNLTGRQRVARDASAPYMGCATGSGSAGGKIT